LIQLLLISNKHESGRGLKHRKQQSPGTHHNSRRNLTPVASTAIHALEGNKLPLGGGSSEYQGPYDSETASFIKPPPLTARVSGLSVESASPSHNQNNNENDNQQLEHSFLSSVTDRAGWLVGLLILQSMSSFIISNNEKLLQQHLVIVRFLTMLVGAGGNAGNQASVGT